MRAVTDLGREIVYDEDNKPGVSNLLVINALCSGRSVAELERLFAGRGYGDLKKDTADAVVSILGPIQCRAKQILQGDEVEDVLALGARKAESMALPTLRRVQRAMGLC